MVKVPRDGDTLNRGQNLFFTTDIEGAIHKADTILVSVNTPTKRHGIGAGSASDISWLEQAVRMIAKVSTSDKIIVEKSTVPCRTADFIRDILATNGRRGVRFSVLSNPEFLSEGTAIKDLLFPDRVLIGSLPDGCEAAAALANMYAEWVPRSRIMTMNLWSSELAKVAANALLAQRISSINALSAVCEAVGARIDEVALAVGEDRRIGRHMLKSSVGFGGSCFKKDVLSLVYMSEYLNLPEVAAYWKAIIRINEWQKERFAKHIIRTLYGTVKGKRIAILGFAYKKNTGDTRESPAISVVATLLDESADLRIYDPRVKEARIWADLDDIQRTVEAKKHVTVCRDAYDACKDAHAVIILTEWDEFSGDLVEDDILSSRFTASVPPVSGMELESGKAYPSSDCTQHRKLCSLNARLDWTQIAKLMVKPMFVFDGRNVVNARKLENLGFRVYCVGDGRDMR